MDPKRLILCAAMSSKHLVFWHLGSELKLLAIYPISKQVAGVWYSEAAGAWLVASKEHTIDVLKFRLFVFSNFFEFFLHGISHRNEILSLFID